MRVRFPNVSELSLVKLESAVRVERIWHFRMGSENARLAQNIKNLEKDIGELKREIRGRDEAIAEKEKRIADLGRPSIGTC